MQELVFHRVKTASNFLREKIGDINVFIILGTGIDILLNRLQNQVVIPYTNIPGFPISTSPEHKGSLVYGRFKGLGVCIFQGRFHYYEGYSASEVGIPVRVMQELGAKNMIICSASGGLKADFKPGDLMVVEDHINLIPDNPLRGKNFSEYGIRFPDLSKAYTKRLIEAATTKANELGIRLHRGVFVAVPGPSLETPAETRFLQLIGAHAVAMSMVPEVICAVHANMNILAIAIIANVNDPDNFVPITIEDVVAGAKMANNNLDSLISSLLEDEAIWK